MRRPTAFPRQLLALMVMGALTGAACTSGSDDGADGARDAPAVTSSTLARTVTGAVDLRRLVVSQALAGYEELASPPFGAVDLTRLLAEFSDAPTEDRIILEAARYKTGYTRGWLRESPRSFLGVFVFEFADEEGARSARSLFAAQNASKRNASRFAVGGIDDAAGESYTQQVEGQPSERVHLVTFVRGPRLYQVGSQFADEQTTPDETVTFARLEAAVAG